MAKATLDNRHRNKDGEISANTETPSFARCARCTARVSQLAILTPSSSARFYLS
jgi:hypothetical protein